MIKFNEQEMYESPWQKMRRGILETNSQEQKIFKANLKQHIKEEWGEVKPPTKPPQDIDTDAIRRA